MIIPRQICSSFHYGIIFHSIIQCSWSTTLPLNSSKQHWLRNGAGLRFSKLSAGYCFCSAYGGRYRPAKKPCCVKLNGPTHEELRLVRNILLQANKILMGLICMTQMSYQTARVTTPWLAEMNEECYLIMRLNQMPRSCEIRMFLILQND